MQCHEIAKGDSVGRFRSIDAHPLAIKQSQKEKEKMPAADIRWWRDKLGLENFVPSI